MTTPTDLDELERLLERATPGDEWFVVRYGDGDSLVICRDEAGNQRIAFMAVPGTRDHLARNRTWKAIKANAALIVTLHNSAAAMIAEIRELRAENARLKKMTNPTWFYHPDYPEYCKFDPSEVIDEGYDPLPGDHVFEIHCAVALPSIWCAVHVSNDPDADERFTHTEHASEAEARAALTGEPQ